MGADTLPMPVLYRKVFSQCRSLRYECRRLPMGGAVRTYFTVFRLMNPRPILASILVAIGFTGCATFTPAELGQIRQRGVSPAVVNKMEDGRVLHPGDVIELTRRGVPDNFIIRQIDDAGVDYVLNRNDMKRLQDARVNRRVVDALV